MNIYIMYIYNVYIIIIIIITDRKNGTINNSSYIHKSSYFPCPYYLFFTLLV